MANLLSNEKYSLYFQKVSLMYKRPEIRASLEVILSVFTVTILVFAAIRPTLTNIVSLQKKIEDQTVIGKKADNKIAQLLSAQTQLNTFRGSLILFDEAVPDEFSYSDSVKRLEYVAKKNNLELETVTFPGYTVFSGGKATGEWSAKLMKPSANILSEQLSFNVTGKPQDVIAFLKEIENMDRLVSLSSVSLTKQFGLSRTEDLLKATGQMIFYFYSQQL